MSAESLIARMHERVRSMDSMSCSRDAKIFFADPVVVTEDGVGYTLVSSQSTSGRELPAGIYAVLNVDLSFYLGLSSLRIAISSSIAQHLGDKDTLSQLGAEFFNVTTSISAVSTNFFIEKDGDKFPLLQIVPSPLGFINQQFPESV